MTPTGLLFICIYLLQLSGIFRLCRATNVLFIVADDLRPNLGCYQQDTLDREDDLRFHTPNIDNLAKQGTIFTNAYAQQALCGPSRTSFLTGRRPDSLRTFDNSRFYWRNKKYNFTTLPQYFKQHNYTTVSAGKVFHPGHLSNKTDDYPYSWSFPTFHPSTEKYMQAKLKCASIHSDELRSHWWVSCCGCNWVEIKGAMYIAASSEIIACAKTLVCGPNHRRNIVCPVNVTEQPGGSLPDLQTADFVVGLLHDDRIVKQPFFIAVGFHKPHEPLKYPVEFRDFYPIDNVEIADNAAIPDNLPDVAWNPWMTIRSRDDITELNISFPYGPMPYFYQKMVRQSYYASISYMDAQVGKVLSALAQSSAANNTIVVVTSDHGWSLGEHGEWEKFSNFGVSTRVPLIVKLPNGHASNKNIDELVELVDLFPSLAELAGLPVPPLCSKDKKKRENTCVEGLSFAPLLKNRQTTHWKTAVFSQYPRPSVLPQMNSDQPRFRDIRIMGYSIRTNEYRYTEWIRFVPKKNKKYWQTVKARELYALNADQEENENLAQLSWRGAMPRTNIFNEALEL